MDPLSPEPPKNPTPIKFGRYELVQRIGAGGMGEVWLARLPGLGNIQKVCVVKKMLSHLADDEMFVRRFLDEAKVVVHLNHGNIAQVYEMGEVNGDYFMAMEYVEGKTVARICSRLRERDERFPLPLALYIGARACDALAYAHRKADPGGRPLHVVHRDISPSNIIVSYDGEVKLIDFGAALSTLKEAQTAPRVVIGNLAYMSPEQARKRPVDGRADVYSISVVLWELISWSALPTGGDHVERWRRAAFPRFTPPSKLKDDVPPFVDQVIMRGLSADPADRFATAEELRDELSKSLNQIAAKTSQTTLACLIATLFRQESLDERALVARAVSHFDPESTERSKRREAQVLPEDVTMPAVDLLAEEKAALERAGEQNKREAIRATVPRDPERPMPPRPPSPDLTRPAPPVAQSESSEQSEPSEPRKPPPPVPGDEVDQELQRQVEREHEREDPERHLRGTDEMPTITWAQPGARRRRFTEGSIGRTVDWSQPNSVRTFVVRVLLFLGAFVAGVVIAIIAYQLLASPSQPEPTPPAAPKEQVGPHRGR